MRQRAKRRQNAVRFESLESRLALAGNVTASLVSGALIIKGDNSANLIRVEQIDSDSFRVVGIGTSVNGSSSRRVDNVVNGIGIDMRSGGDQVILQNLTVPGAGLGVLLGAGNDVLTVSNVRVNGFTAIDGGTDTDAISIDRGNLRWNTGIKTRSGDDSLVIQRTNILGSLSIQMDAGTDALSMVDVTVLERQNPPLLPVVEIPPQFEILAEAFFDIESGAYILTGTGTDSVALNKVQIDGLTVIDTNNGVGNVSIVNSRFGQVVEELEQEGIGLIVENGSSNDTVAINNTTVYGYLEIDTTQGQLPALQESLQSLPSDGIDSVALSQVNVLNALAQGAPSIEAESQEYGGEVFGFLEVFTGNQGDTVSMVFVNTDGPAVIYTTDGSASDGNDTVAISQSNFNRQGFSQMFGIGQIPLYPSGLYIVTGAGIDAVTIAQVNVRDGVAIFTEDGTDRVAISALAADQIYVDLGNGNNDALTITNSSAEEAYFFGGDGSGDTLVRANNNFGFQSPPPNNGFETIV